MAIGHYLAPAEPLAVRQPDRNPDLHLLSRKMI
jgi:hypothetical protein